MKSAGKLLGLIELPLLVKELNEQAARKRTYVIRFLYAFLLFAAACSIFYGNFLSGGATNAFGRGRGMFENLVSFQFWCIYLFLPAISCGALTAEKERNTLGLLLITTLRPWQIVLQKVLGRVIPMLTFILLSFPLMAVAYSFGGVTEDQLWSGILLLVLTCFQVGALSVACSAFFATTVEAYMATYALFIVLRLMLPFGWGPYLFERASDISFAATAAASILLVLLTGMFLIAGWAVLEARAFIPPKNVLLNVFRWLDRYFNDMNQVTGGVVLVKDGDPLPGDQPVAWRETAKKSLGTFRYLFRVLVVVEVPLLFICQALRFNGPGGANIEPVTYSLYMLWMLGTAMTIVHAGSVISAERTRQTLDVLLTTPLCGSEILRQKLRGVRRLLGVLLVPFLTIFLFETWWNQSATYRWVYPLVALATVLIYLPLTVWFSLWIGLKVRSQIKAVLTAMALVGFWLLVPTIARAALTQILGIPVAGMTKQLLLLNPAELIPAVEAMGRLVIETGKPLEKQPPQPLWFTFAANLLLHGTAWYALRWYVLRSADHLLGRLGETPQQVRFESAPAAPVAVTTNQAVA